MFWAQLGNAVGPWVQSSRVESCVGECQLLAWGEAVRGRFVGTLASERRWSPRPSVCAQECCQQSTGDAALIGGVYEGPPLWDPVDRESVALLVSPACRGSELL